MLLEELRWNSLLIEHQENGENSKIMKRSYRNSFARTIREHFPELALQKLPRPDGLHAGIVLRAALHRLASWDDIQRFKNGSSPTMFAHWSKDTVLVDHSKEDYFERDSSRRPVVTTIQCTLYPGGHSKPASHGHLKTGHLDSSLVG